MSETTSVILVGVGGQGILLASGILAQAAMLSGYDVKTNEVHGMAQRGGSVMGQVRYGKIVASPLIEEGTAQALASLEAIEGLRAAHFLRPGGLAVVSTQRIVPVTVSSGAAAYPADAEGRCGEVFGNLRLLDAVGMAIEAGNARAANVVVVGALSNGLTLEVGAWEEAIGKLVKPQHLELNLKAFRMGRGARG